MGRPVTVIEAPDGRPVQVLTRRFGPFNVAYVPRADLGAGRARVLSRLPRFQTALIIPETDAVPRRGCWPILTPQHVAEINVPRSPVHDTLWANMHGKWRNRLRRAIGGPLGVFQTTYSPERHDPLLARERAQRRRRGYRSYPPEFLAAYAYANRHNTALYEARLGEDTVAFMLFLTHGPVATYAVGWTGPEGRTHHAHNLLLWEAMRTMFSKGIMRIDLGTIDTDDGWDLARFKLGSGARTRTLGPTLLVPPGFRVSP